MHIKTGDKVQVIKGKDKGKVGEVLVCLPKKNKVIVEGVNMVTKHKKPRSQADLGGIIHQEAAIASCKVMHICEKCKQPTRIGYKMLEGGAKVRVCKKCGETFEN